MACCGWLGLQIAVVKRPEPTTVPALLMAVATPNGGSFRGRKTSPAVGLQVAGTNGGVKQTV